MGVLTGVRAVTGLQGTPGDSAEEEEVPRKPCMKASPPAVLALLSLAAPLLAELPRNAVPPPVTASRSGSAVV